MLVIFAQERLILNLNVTDACHSRLSILWRGLNAAGDITGKRKCRRARQTLFTASQGTVKHLFSIETFKVHWVVHVTFSRTWKDLDAKGKPYYFCLVQRLALASSSSWRLKPRVSTIFQMNRYNNSSWLFVLGLVRPHCTNLGNRHGNVISHHLKNWEWLRSFTSSVPAQWGVSLGLLSFHLGECTGPWKASEWRSVHWMGMAWC